MKHLKKGGLFAAAVVFVTAQAAAAAVTAAQKCEAGKNQAAGTYFNCLSKAEKALVTKGDAVKYGDAVAKCDQKLLYTWTKLEASAVAAGDPCPAEGDLSAVQQLLEGCNSGVVEAASGGTPPPDPQMCEADLSTCDSELATCQSSSGLPATGQTTAYGAGSDGDLNQGVARSFTDNGDGTITDHTTGLMWEKKSDDGSIHDKDNTYTWGMTSPPYTMNGTMVTTFLAALNGGGGFAGYTDWRIPNQFELYSLVNLEVFYPSMYPEFNNACTGGCTVTTCSCTQSGSHWSSSTVRGFPDSAWGVYFDYGFTGATGKAGIGFVRAVRAGS